MNKIGLALGGGGAKGFAHIGVLHALEELAIHPDLLTGTSMGGVIAALYAAGLSVEHIEASLRATGLTVFAAREPSRLGLVGRAKLMAWLDGLLGDVTFDHLPRKLAMMAVDLESGAEVVLDHGRVIDAVLATTAFPGLFAPVEHDGRYLIDGGALNNVPFDVARHLGAEQVIASDVLAHRVPLFQNPASEARPVESLVHQLLTRTGAGALWEVVDRTITIMQEGHVQDKIKTCPPDVMVCPEVGHIALFDVRHFDACLAAGVAAVRAHEVALARLQAKAARTSGRRGGKLRQAPI
jgi:NTE family protein